MSDAPATPGTGSQGDQSGAQAPQQTPGTPQAPQTPAAPQAPAQAPAAAPAATPQQPAEGDLAALPEWAQKLIKDAQAPAAPTPPAPVTPAAPEQGTDGDLSRLPKWAQQQLTQAQEQAKTAAVQAAVLRAAPAAGADVAALLDSQSAMTALAAVDPNDQAAVTEAIKNAVAAQPRLAAIAGPARGGADFGTPAPPERKPGSLHDAIAARLGA